jgi:dTDP-glucose 4,6-dehydratase
MPLSRTPILITGGAGFIGSCFTHRAIAAGARVVVLDLFTYAGRHASLPPTETTSELAVVPADVCDPAQVRALFQRTRPRAVVHFAAETHVDRSIDDASAFVATNVGGTQTLLDAAIRYWRELGPTARDEFRFIHVSTDEVFGPLTGPGAFSETSPYRPRSPYAASKSGADHLVQAAWHTHGLPVMITYATNNYGPRQFPEKLIPHMIMHALQGRSLPLYGRGENVRDWIFVDDHCEALEAVLEHGRPAESYCIGAAETHTNLDVVKRVCAALDELAPRPDGREHKCAIVFVPDRPGHDFAYALNAAKIMNELGWHPRTSFDAGIRATVAWYLANRDWWEPIQEAGYAADRLGLAWA